MSGSLSLRKKENNEIIKTFQFFLQLFTIYLLESIGGHFYVEVLYIRIDHILIRIQPNGEYLHGTPHFHN